MEKLHPRAYLKTRGFGVKAKFYGDGSGVRSLCKKTLKNVTNKLDSCRTIQKKISFPQKLSQSSKTSKHFSLLENCNTKPKRCYSGPDIVIRVKEWKYERRRKTRASIRSVILIFPE